MDKLKLEKSLGEVSIITDRAKDEQYILLLAHGAGAGLQQHFLHSLAHEISSLHGTVVRFNFPYIEQGKKFPGLPRPNIETIGQLITFASREFEEMPIVISGKSYGGRMCSHWAAKNPDSPEMGIVYFGFPLHPAEKVSKDRATHLPQVKKPQLFIQGTNDALAHYPSIQEVAAGCKADLITIEHADHSFKAPKKLSGLSPDEIIRQIATDTDTWIMKTVNTRP